MRVNYRKEKPEFVPLGYVGYDPRAFARRWIHAFIRLNHWVLKKTNVDPLPLYEMYQPKFFTVVLPNILRIIERDSDSFYKKLTLQL
jgi:hypothetical protein